MTPPPVGAAALRSDDSPESSLPVKKHNKSPQRKQQFVHFPAVPSRQAFVRGKAFPFQPCLTFSARFIIAAFRSPRTQMLREWAGGGSSCSLLTSKGSRGLQRTLIQPSINHRRSLIKLRLNRAGTRRTPLKLPRSAPCSPACSGHVCPCLAHNLHAQRTAKEGENSWECGPFWGATSSLLCFLRAEHPTARPSSRSPDPDCSSRFCSGERFGSHSHQFNT